MNINHGRTGTTLRLVTTLNRLKPGREGHTLRIILSSTMEGQAPLCVYPGWYIAWYMPPCVPEGVHSLVYASLRGVHRVYNLVYMPPWWGMGGIHPGICCPGGYGRYTTPWYMPPYLHPGYTSYPVHAVRGRYRCHAAGGGGPGL